jgi:inner membrane protease subunit 2
MIRLQRLGRSLIQGLTFAPVVYFIHESVFTIVPVQGASMQPALNPPTNLRENSRADDAVSRDVIFVSRFSRYFWNIRRGEIVVLRSPEEGPRKRLVKRVVALEGDSIYNDRTGRLVVVPRGYCWVEGDNRATSRDSASQYGPVPLGLIEGRVTAIIWPPGRWQILSASRLAKPAAASELGSASASPGAARALGKPTNPK